MGKFLNDHIENKQTEYKQKYKVIEDEASGFVTIKVKHQSPIIANAWTELIVDQINDFFRAKDKLEAQAAMDYLNIQMAQTSFAEIKLVIAQLLQQKMQQLALIETNEFYVFSYLSTTVAIHSASATISSSTFAIPLIIFNSFAIRFSGLIKRITICILISKKTLILFENII